jgi:hypothetical protein
MTREELDGLTLFHCRFIHLAWMFNIVPLALRMAIDMVVADGTLGAHGDHVCMCLPELCQPIMEELAYFRLSRLHICGGLAVAVVVIFGRCCHTYTTCRIWSLRGRVASMRE